MYANVLQWEGVFMIEFSGEILEQNKVLQAKVVHKKATIKGWLICLLCSIPVIAVVLIGKYFYAMFYVFPLVYAIIESFPRSKYKNSYFYPTKIAIDIEYDIIRSLGKGFIHNRKISDIKRIDDNGDHYRIWFKATKISPYFICQKDLITQGTLEEFEEKFADLIVRKTE